MRSRDANDLSAARIACIGLLGLAAAMGIGRFAFTPLLPLMQAHEGLTLTQGGWLAGANYLGYLLGALACAARPPRPARAARWGLIGVALFTLAAAWIDHFTGLAVLRFGAGVSSALVLVGVSSWALPLLAAQRRADLTGWVFAGVGIGITAAGLIGLVAGVLRSAPMWAWLALGVITALVTAFALRDLHEPRTAFSAAPAAPTAPLSRSDWTLVACYGAFGFGYIIPATFLPAFARALIDDPLAFGAVWPVFGMAAAASTVLATRWLAWPPHRVWAASQIVMAFGVLLQALRPNLLTTVVCALCVGGTLVVATMAGIQHARQVAADRAARLIGTMTAAFAFGQLIGPFLVRGAAASTVALGPSVAAALLLIASSVVLLAQRRA